MIIFTSTLDLRVGFIDMFNYAALFG